MKLWMGKFIFQAGVDVSKYHVGIGQLLIWQSSLSLAKLSC